MYVGICTKIHGSYGIKFASKMGQILDFNMISMAPNVGAKKSSLKNFFESSRISNGRWNMISNTENETTLDLRLFEK